MAVFDFMGMTMQSRFAPLTLVAALFAGPSLAGEDHPLFAHGKTLYKDFCAHCHGINMINPGTSSYDLRKYPVEEKASFSDAVNNGKGDMPAWGDILLPDEIDAIWVYVATRAGAQPFPKIAAAAPDIPPVPEAELIVPGTMTACLDVKGGIMSTRRTNGGAGFDYEVLAAVADRLDLKLDVTWFEGTQDEFEDPIPQAYAMLSMPLCDVVAAHPVFPGTDGPIPTARAAPPHWDDQPDHWRPGTQVDLSPIRRTRPYMRAVQGIVFSNRTDVDDMNDLAAISEFKIGVQQGTLGEAILRRQGSPAAMAEAVTVPPGPNFLWEMEKGAFEVTLTDTAAFDFHLRQNMLSQLKLGSYRHPLGVNIALATSEKNAGLRASIDAVLEALLTEGVIGDLAKKARMTYTPPNDETQPNFQAVLRAQ